MLVSDNIAALRFELAADLATSAAGFERPA
jgi:hypothetical protein